MFVFRKIWGALFSWNTRFEIRSFALLPTNWQNKDFLPLSLILSKTSVIATRNATVNAWEILFYDNFIQIIYLFIYLFIYFI